VFESAAVLAVLLVVVAAATMVLSALLERSGPVRLRHWAEEAGGRLLALYEARGRFEVFRYLLASLAKLAPVVLAIALSFLLRDLGVPASGTWAIAAVVGLVLAAEAVNRWLVGSLAEESLRKLTPLYRALHGLFLPLVLPLAALVPAPRPEEPDDEEDGEEEDEISDEEIEAYIDFGTREGILEPGEGELVWGIVDFGDTQVRSVMTPRIDMVVAAADEDLEALADRFLESGHSRIPLYEESVDRIVGILHIREVLRALRNGGPAASAPPSARELAKEPFFVPDRKPLDELLKEMQARFQQVAIVLDEYGGTSGLVTVEDLLEEIVGEIFDEDEAVVEPDPVQLPDGSWRVDGRVHAELLDELFEVDVEEEPYETVGGMILAELGRVPAAGESVAARGLRLTVEEITGRRIRSVRVERIVAAAADEPGAEPAPAEGEETHG